MPVSLLDRVLDTERISSKNRSCVLRSQDRGRSLRTAYVPLDTGGATFELRTTSAPGSFIPAVRKSVQDVDDNVPLMQMRTQSEAIDRLLFNQQLMARLLGGFAALGLGLACIGLYGLLSYEVVRRTRGIGVRTALGAQRSDVPAPFFRRGLVVVLLGSAAGVGSATGATRC